VAAAWAWCRPAGIITRRTGAGRCVFKSSSAAAALSQFHRWHSPRGSGIVGGSFIQRRRGWVGNILAEKSAMRLSIVTFMHPGAEPRGHSLDRIANYARRIEAAGFPGIWVTDSLGRGRATLEPMVALSALAAVTKRVELGTAVLQVSLRHPIDLAHRVQSVQALSGNRLRLGVGSGSTQADFDLFGADYSQRFRTLMASLDIMRRTWRGDTVNGGALTPWPGSEGGPPILLGAWRNPRWITYAARHCQGWIASGLYSSWEDLENGMRIYREAGGANAVLANVVVDLNNRPEPGSLAERARVSLVCLPDDARPRLKRIEQIGFDEVLLISPASALDELERVRDYL
jgi:alkanesulfonate monooxygenase SsuD/methylene tetrahydromethanopterin reductase-like flavin-dependent oxidoreductase (luciferase family)